MAKIDLPTPDELRQLVHYEPENGKLFWRERPDHMFKSGKNTPTRSAKIWNTRYAGKEAFSYPNTHGHLFGAIRTGRGRAKIYAHRAAWAYVYGEWPEIIDHINGDPSDNRIANLRSVTQALNGRNQRLRATNTSGHCGVYFYKSRKMWTAQIMVDGKSKSLGYFQNKQDAVDARLSAQKDMGFTDRHGSI
jgi:hypothetical protein